MMPLEERTFASRFSYRLKLCRRARRLTQKQLADMLVLEGEAITPSTISHYEQAVSMPTLVRLAKLSYVLGVSTDYLLTLTENPKRV